MWCGSSIWHTERCIGAAPARYLQLWITPGWDLNTTPYYEIYDKPARFERLNILLKQNITISGGLLEESVTSQYSYLYIVSGSCTANGIVLNQGDGAELTEFTEIKPLDNPHILLFELPA
jgi:redox-sensitive bicupin YhaK (pirin superfamily)